MSLQCETCLCEGPDTVREAKAAGWRDIHRVPATKNLLDWNTHSGTCPRCVLDEEEELYEQAVSRGEHPPKPLLVRSKLMHCPTCRKDVEPHEYGGSRACPKCGNPHLETILEATT